MCNNNCCKKFYTISHVTLSQKLNWMFSYLNLSNITKKCNKISMEEYILFLFIEKLDKLPIAQNVLICSNETSIEEMQSFFYKAILCNFNTLFVVEILEYTNKLNIDNYSTI